MTTNPRRNLAIIRHDDDDVIQCGWCKKLWPLESKEERAAALDHNCDLRPQE